METIALNFWVFEAFAILTSPRRVFTLNKNPFIKMSTMIRTAPPLDLLMVHQMIEVADFILWELGILQCTFLPVAKEVC